MGDTNMVTNKWSVYRKLEPQGFPCWAAVAPNGTETEHPTHAAAMHHVTQQQHRRTTLAALLLSLLTQITDRLPTPTCPTDHLPGHPPPTTHLPA